MSHHLPDNLTALLDAVKSVNPPDAYQDFEDILTRAYTQGREDERKRIEALLRPEPTGEENQSN